jgi:hypothetical protein
MNGWSATVDVASDPLGLGVHRVHFGAATLAGHWGLDFTFRYGARWEGLATVSRWGDKATGHAINHQKCTVGVR